MVKIVVGQFANSKKGSTRLVIPTMVKQRDVHVELQGIKVRVIYGKKSEVIELLGKSTAYVERNNLTSWLFNGRQTRKTLAFSKDLQCHRAAAVWEDYYYNLVRPLKSLRLHLEDVLPQK